jgi:hypothetical protein
LKAGTKVEAFNFQVTIRKHFSVTENSLTEFRPVWVQKNEINHRGRTPSMTGWRHASAFMAVVALLLDAHTGVWAQASNERTDTFEQRFPPDQVTTPPGGEQPPRQPPVRQAPIQPPADLSQKGQHSSEGGAQPKKSVTTVASARRPRSRVTVAPRSFLDAGTAVLPGDRKFLDYAFPPLHTPTDVVTNTGGRVGWHRSPLPGPLFPGPGPW